MSQGNTKGKGSDGEASGKIPYISAPPFAAPWHSAAITRFLRERKLQSLAVVLSGISAWFAWQNNSAQKEAAKPRITLQTVTLNPTKPNSFQNVTVRIEYKNVGGTAAGGTKVKLKVVSVGRPSPVIAEGDDASQLMAGDNRSFEFPGVNMAGPNVGIVACFDIDDARVEPNMFGFTFSKDLRMFHLDSRSWEIAQHLRPCVD